MKTIKIKEVCKNCGGTGIYVGMAERDGFGVVCHTCSGTGCNEYVHSYELFKKRKVRKDVKQVLKTNPGITVGIDKLRGLGIWAFGGMPYSDWNNGSPFPMGSEMRNFTCPAWYYQCADYSLKPEWDECIRLGLFSSCKSFLNKSECWKRFDAEHKK